MPFSVANVSDFIAEKHILPNVRVIARLTVKVTQRSREEKAVENFHGVREPEISAIDCVAVFCQVPMFRTMVFISPAVRAIDVVTVPS